MKTSIFILLFLTSFISCRNVSTINTPEFEIKKEKYPILIKVDEARSNLEMPLLSNFSDDVLYIKLKTPPNTFVKSIVDVQISNHMIYIQTNSNIMVFDFQGNFIKQFGKVGRGPSEYIHLRSFCFDKDNQYILLYTGDSGNVLKFSNEGVFIEKVFGFYFADRLYSLNNNLVFSGIVITDIRNVPNNITQYAITNMTGQMNYSVPLPIYSVNNWREETSNFPGNSPATRYEDFLLLYSVGEDTIFHVTSKGKIESRYYLDFRRKAIPFESRYVNLTENWYDYIRGNSRPFESANNFWMKFTLHKGAFILRYDKIEKKAFTFHYKGEKEIDLERGKSEIKEFGLINDIDGGLDFFPSWSVYDDSTQLFVSPLQAFDLKTKLTPEYFENRESKFPEKKEKLINLVNNLTEKDDFVLMVVKLK